MSAKTVVQCGNCQTHYRVDSRMVGRVARCPRCHHHFVMTAKASLDDSVVDWLLDDEHAEHTETSRPVIKAASVTPAAAPPKSHEPS